MHHAQTGRFHGFAHLLFRRTRSEYWSSGEDKQEQ